MHTKAVEKLDFALNLSVIFHLKSAPSMVGLDTNNLLTVSGHFHICRYVRSLAYLNPLRSLILGYFNPLRSLILAHFNMLRSLMSKIYLSSMRDLNVLKCARMRDLNGLKYLRMSDLKGLRYAKLLTYLQISKCP